MDKSDFAKRLADKLIEQLKAGTAPWQQPWEAGQMASPYNPTTGNRYRGVNILALMANAYTDPRWMTYKQVLVAAVFNAEQIDGIPDLEPARDVGWDPLEKAERLLGASRAKIQHSQGGRAFYRPSTDTIHLPSRERFETAAGYFATALHELGHNADSRIMPLAFPVPRSVHANPISWSA